MLTCLIAGCRSGSGDRLDAKTSDSKIRKISISIAEDYVSGQLKDPKKSVTPDGLISISDDQKKYIIDPARVFVGLVDDDQEKDAIVSILSFQGQNLNIPEHLIILRTNGRLMLIKSIESDIKILELKDRVITAEIHTKPRTSPLYHCPSCIEIVKFRYTNGDLSRI